MWLRVVFCDTYWRDGRNALLPVATVGAQLPISGVTAQVAC